MAPCDSHLAAAAAGPISAARARLLAASSSLAAVRAAAVARRDRSWGRVVTYSPKVFVPLTNLCPNRCGYCAFRRSPGDVGAWTMTREQVEQALDRAAASGCTEALLCIGDRPERAFGVYRAELRARGFDDTVGFLVWAARAALERGILAHTNAGLLDPEAMERLRTWSASFGLMLESTSARLHGPGGPHRRAPDKSPEARLQMIDEAGVLRIPLTTGLLVGIGETRDERIDTLAAIRAAQEAHGHIQEVIVQGFRPAMGTPMARSPEPSAAVLEETIALARVILPDCVSVQSPPNLTPAGVEGLLAAGVNDLGGISPLTPDYVNPGHPWPNVEALSASLRRAGHELRPRLAVYDAYIEAGWVSAATLECVSSARARWSSVRFSGAFERSSFAVVRGGW